MANPSAFGSALSPEHATVTAERIAKALDIPSQNITQAPNGLPHISVPDTPNGVSYWLALKKYVDDAGAGTGNATDIKSVLDKNGTHIDFPPNFFEIPAKGPTGYDTPIIRAIELYKTQCRPPAYPQDQSSNPGPKTRYALRSVAPKAASAKPEAKQAPPEKKVAARPRSLPTATA
jgi:hypothetical protein